MAYGKVLWLGLMASLTPSILLVLAVAGGWSDKVDRQLLKVLVQRSRPRDTEKLTRLGTAARDLTAIGGDTLRLLFLSACMVELFAAGRPEPAWQLLAIFVSARAALFLLKVAIRRERPNLVQHGIDTYTTSFPSGHSFMAAALFVAAALLIPGGEPVAIRLAAIGIALFLSLTVAITRLAFGIHWPSDIIAGWLGGIAWAIGGALLSLWISR